MLQHWCQGTLANKKISYPETDTFILFLSPKIILEEGRIVAQYLIENETELRRKQILRKASYQGGAYRQQLGNGHPAEPPQEAPGRHGLRGGLPERGELPGAKRPEDTAPVSALQDDGDAHRGQQVHGADRGAHGKGE